MRRKWSIALMFLSLGCALPEETPGGSSLSEEHETDAPETTDDGLTTDPSSTSSEAVTSSTGSSTTGSEPPVITTLVITSGDSSSGGESDSDGSTTGQEPILCEMSEECPSDMLCVPFDDESWCTKIEETLVRGWIHWSPLNCETAYNYLAIQNEDEIIADSIFGDDCDDLPLQWPGTYFVYDPLMPFKLQFFVKENGQYVYDKTFCWSIEEQCDAAIPQEHIHKGHYVIDNDVFGILEMYFIFEEMK